MYLLYNPNNLQEYFSPNISNVKDFISPCIPLYFIDGTTFCDGIKIFLVWRYTYN